VKNNTGRIGDILNLIYNHGANKPHFAIVVGRWILEKNVVLLVKASSEIIALMVSLSVNMFWWRRVVLCLHWPIEHSHIVVHWNYHLFLHDGI